MGARRVIFVATTFCAVVACGTLTGVISGGSDADDGGAIAVADGATVDAPAADAEGGATTRFCDDHRDALVCSDFDDSDAAAFAHGWDQVFLDAGDGVGATATLAPALDDFRTSPSSLRSTVSALAGWTVAAPVARLAKHLGAPDAGGATLTFDLFLRDAVLGTSSSVAEIYWDKCGHPFDGVWLYQRAGALALFVNDAEVDAGPIPATPGWHHVVIEGQWSAQTVTVGVDGVTTTLPITPPCAGAKDAYSAQVGLAINAGTGPAMLDYDNVVVDVIP